MIKTNLTLNGVALIQKTLDSITKDVEDAYPNSFFDDTISGRGHTLNRTTMAMTCGIGALSVKKKSALARNDENKCSFIHGEDTINRIE